MNFTDRTYVAVHLILALLVCVRYEYLQHWPAYLIWNLVSIGVIMWLVRKQESGEAWRFAHDWLPAIFFITVFEQISFLALSVRGNWQNEYIIAFESSLLHASPMEWMHVHARNWVIEFLEFGYFAFYPLYPTIGGLFWAWQGQPQFRGAFRRLTDTLTLGYVMCYTAYVLFPTQSPANRVGVQEIGSTHGGIFERAVRDLQDHAGAHGNAFPSAHIMLAFVVLMFVYRYLPRIAPWLLFPILLMCAGAIYDGYHYASDVTLGAIIGITLGAIGTRTGIALAKSDKRWTANKQNPLREERVRGLEGRN